MHKDKIIVYTDGSARGNPGPAGYGAVMFIDGEKFEIGGHSDKATNNQMELKAPIEALKYLKHKKIKDHIEIYCDSKYVVLGITEWVKNWMKNGWRNAAKKPVLNKELWVELYDLVQDFDIKWIHIEGHAGIEHNERADVIATSFADNDGVI